MREWLVIESSLKNSVFAPPGAHKVGYLPRDVVEPLLGRKIEDGRCTWFTAHEAELMRAHPAWRTESPDWSPLGFWLD